MEQMRHPYLRSVGYRRATPLSLLALAIAFATPAGGQAPVRARADTASFIVKILRSAEEAGILARFDSLRRMLDNEPLNSADREKLRAEIEQLLRPLIEKDRVRAEFARGGGGGA